MKAGTMARTALGAGTTLLLLAGVVVWAQDEPKTGGKSLLDSLDSIGVREASGDPFRSEDTETGFLLVCETFNVPPDSGKFIASGKGRNSVVLVLPDANLRMACEHLEYDLNNEGYDLTGNASVEQSNGEQKMVLKGERIRVTPMGENESKIELIGSASRRAHLTSKNPAAGQPTATGGEPKSAAAKAPKAGPDERKAPAAPALQKSPTPGASPVKPVSIISPGRGAGVQMDAQASPGVDTVVRDWQVQSAIPAG